MARLRAVVVALETDGDVYAGATVKFYVAGTATLITTATTSGTPFDAGSLYTAISGGSPISTTGTLNSNGTLVIFSDGQARFDVGIEPVGGGAAFIRQYETMEFDPADVVTLAGSQTLTNKTLTSPIINSPTIATPTISSPTIAGQALFANGSAAAPAIGFTNDTGSGIYRPADNQIAVRANNAVEWLLDGNTTPAGPRSYITDPNGTKSVMTLTRGTGVSSGVIADSTYTAAFAASSFANADAAGLNSEGIGGYGYAVQGSGGFIMGVKAVAEATTAGSWTASGTHGIIGLYGAATSYKASARVWGSNILARQYTTTGSALVGLEVGIENTGGVQDRYGIQIVTLSQGGGAVSNENIGLKFADKMSPTDQDNLWATGIGFASPDIGSGTIGFPVRTDGTLIRAYGTATVADILNVSGLNITDSILKAEKVRLTSLGRLRLGTTAAAAASGTMFHATGQGGDTYVMELDSMPTGTTVGAAGGASALPATPLGYMPWRFNGVAVRVPFYPAP